MHLDFVRVQLHQGIPVYTFNLSSYDDLQEQFAAEKEAAAAAAAAAHFNAESNQGPTPQKQNYM